MLVMDADFSIVSCFCKPLALHPSCFATLGPAIKPFVFEGNCLFPSSFLEVKLGRKESVVPSRFS
jgi:hypothetical protein